METLKIGIIIHIDISEGERISPQNEAKVKKTVTLPTAILSDTRVASRITSPPLPGVTKDAYLK